MDYLKCRRKVSDQIDSRQAPEKSGRQAVPLLINCYCGTAGDPSLLELLVAMILSAQCTDKRINQITPVLFERYLTAQSFGYGHPRARYERTIVRIAHSEPT